MDKRYSSPSAGRQESDSVQFIEKCDELINFLLNISIPEVDIDQYKIAMGISAQEFASKKANEFRSSFFSSQQSGSQTQSGENNVPRLASSENFSDVSPHSGAGAYSEDGKRGAG